MWANPNEFYAILRCTNIKYAKKLMDFGSIKFNTAEEWVKQEKEYGKGRGDILEGTFAACNPLDIKNVIRYSKEYNDVYGETIDGLTYFRRKRTMGLPCYCFYLLKQELFECPNKEGKQKISGIIPGKYFRDFIGNRTEEDILKLPTEEQPSIVLISDCKKFIEMIKQKLMSFGLKEYEILYETIEYGDKRSAFYYNGKSPKELKLKDNYFSHQAEGRIIINTDNTSIKQYLINNPIEIGCINEISQKKDIYLKDGVLIDMTVNVYKIQK